MKRPFKVIIIGLSLWLLPVLLVACADNTGTASDVAHRYLDDMRTANFSDAYDLLSADSQLKISRSQYVDRLNRARQEAGITSNDVVRVEDPSVAGKRASVAYQLEVGLQNGQKLSLYESMILLQQDSGWRVIWPPQ